VVVLVARGVVLGVTLLEEAALPEGVALRGLVDTAASCLFLLDSVASCKRDLLRSALLSREGVPWVLAGMFKGGTSGLRDASAGLVAGGCGCKVCVLGDAFAFTAAVSAVGGWVFWCKGSDTRGSALPSREAGPLVLGG